METRIKRLAWTAVLVFALLLLWVGRPEASEPPGNGPFDVQELSLTYRSFFPGGRSPLVTDNSELPNRELGKGLLLSLDTDVLRYFYWNNTVHTTTERRIADGGGQFRSIGWEFVFGLHATPWLDFGYHHHSQHVLDSSYAPGFPVEDALEMKLLFIGKRAGDSVFP